MTRPPLDRSLFDLGPPAPCPERFNIAAHVTGWAGKTPDKPALLVTHDASGEVAERWTHGAIATAIRATAGGLRRAGLKPGERVALRLGNVSDFPILFFGTIAAGGIAVPTSSQLTPGEFARIADDMTPRFVAVSDGLAVPDLRGATVLGGDAIAALRQGPEDAIAATGPDDPAFIVYTSGTGGSPKGVLHAQRSAWARRMMWDGWYGLGPDDLMLHAGAFNWTYTLGTGLTDPWAAGATTLIHAGPTEPALWPRLIKRHSATIFAAVPGAYRQILKLGNPLASPLDSLRHGLTAGERMPEALAEEWRRRTARPVYEALGMSEVSTYVSSSPSVPPKPGTSGRPQPGRRVAILGEEEADPLPVGTPGRLAVSRRDPGLMLGYWNRPADTAAAFRGEWFLTGDRAAMDHDGYLTYHGRADEVMTSLGYRVSPAEVEEALATHSAIAEIAVAELPVRNDLALIAAFVVPRGDWPGDEALAAHAADCLAAYKCPRIWIPVERIPRTANGKTLRRKLVAEHRRDR